MSAEFIKKKIIAMLFLMLSASFGIGDALAEKRLTYLEQGWDEQERTNFYTTPQGSFLIPLDWYFSLEQGDNTRLFSKKSNISSKYKYLFDSNNDQEYISVPLGFAVEPAPSGEMWMGYTCAGCHTGDVTYRGTRIRIDGAPTMADTQGFLIDMHAAIKDTLEDKAKFFRFAERITNQYDWAKYEKLREDLASYEANFAKFLQRNEAGMEYGYGRLDAFGFIMNELFAEELDFPDNAKTPNAPASFPFLWGTPSHDWVEWNGSANNPIARNVSEVLGTFGSVDLINPETLGNNTARTKDLIYLERLVAKLTAPAWPEKIFGQIDPAKAERGKTIYTAYRGDEPSCASCHALRGPEGNYPLTPPDENLFGAQFVVTHMTPLEYIGTDPTYALNFATRRPNTAGLAPFLPEPYTGLTELPAPLLLRTIVGLATSKGLDEIDPPLTDEELAAAIGYRIEAPDLPPYAPRNLLAYRARPLDGIWATAPYLHNGSVQNLYELLLPGKERKTTFYVGSRQFDTNKVGFKSQANANTSMLDASIPGNSNLGHEYGTTLSEQERWELIEFMKTL